MEGERITGNTQWDGLGRPAIFYAMLIAGTLTVCSTLFSFLRLRAKTS